MGKGATPGKLKGSWFTCFNGPWRLCFHITGFVATSQQSCEHKLKMMGKLKTFRGTSGRVKACAFLLENQSEGQCWDD